MVVRNGCVIFAVVIIMLLSVTTSFAASKAEIDARVKEAIATFYETTSAGKELAEKAPEKKRRGKKKSK